MRLLLYKDLNLRRVKAALEKVKAAIEADDFRSADVKKLHVGPYFRAKLDYANRLLLQFARIQRDDGPEMVCLALEVIENHAYDRSRFLRGAVVDESRIERESAPEARGPALAAEATPLRWLGPGRTQFELLDKPIVFDDAQEEAYRQPAPLVVIGSAGSGKTAVTLARLREAEGRVLYVTLSAYLAQSARALHDAHGFENAGHEVHFLSYRDLLETLRVPRGREVSLAAFAAWCERHRASPSRAGRHRCAGAVRGIPRRHRRAAAGAAVARRLPGAGHAAEPAGRGAARTGARSFPALQSVAGRGRPVRQQPGRARLAHADRRGPATGVRLRRHRRGAGPDASAAGAGAGAAEAAGRLHSVW